MYELFLRRPSALLTTYGYCACALIVACAVTADAFAARPEPPVIDRDTHLVENGEFLDPYLPAIRTSNDGRIGIEVENSVLKFYLLTPEKVHRRWHLSTPGTSRILADQSPFRGGIIQNPAPNQHYAHKALCETTNAFPSSTDDANPYVCGPNNDNDCYDLTHIGWVDAGRNNESTRLWGTPLTIEVANPKTAAARIVDVQVGSSIGGPDLPSPVFWETTFTTDGRLIVGRLERRRNWTFINAHDGNPHTGRYDIVYSLLEDGAEACDVRQWQRFFPIAHAPYDPRMKAKYGIAAFPFRGGDGRPVAPTADFGGTYPWIDREGNNLFMTTLSEQLSEQVANYPNRCVPGTSCLTREHDGPLKGNAVAGLWTQGKLVHFDNLLNNTDWGLPIDPNGHRLVTLYERRDGTPVEVRVGAGGRNKAREYPDLAGRTNNTAIQDSIQNLFNHADAMMPKSPRDVVWLMSNGKATDELVFDDYLNPDSFIVSSMIGGLSTDANGRVRHENGFTNGSFSDDVHLQNAAAALESRWRIPAFGFVARGTGRVEPIAQGGVHGRGFWLDGSNAIRYRIESQPQDPAASDWYVGLFVDSRFANDSTRRNVIRYPDGTSLRLEGRDALLFMQNENVLTRMDLAEAIPDSGFSHIGINLSDRNRNLVIYVDGYEFARTRIDGGFFNLVPGDLVVGGSDGFRGWVDDFKVFAQNVNPEVACNHAAGTLIGVNGNAEWDTKARRYPASAHGQINQLVRASNRPTSTRYACYTNYLSKHGIDGNDVPDGTVSIQEAINFPEGPVVHNEPRPDSSTNTFCLACHHDEAPDGLDIDALRLNPNLTATNDPRRQPLQHLRMVHGNIPAGWLGGRVTESIKVGREGFLLDPLLLTRSRPDPRPTDPPTVGFSRTELRVAEGDGHALLRVELSEASNETTAVTLATNVDSAKPGADFYGKSTRFSFAPGETEKSTQVQILDDTADEPDEQFKVRLLNPDKLVLGQRQLNVVIVDDDDGSIPSLSVASIDVDEGDGAANVTISLSAAASGPVSVHIATQSDQAVNREDYYGLHRIVEFNVGETTKTVPVTIVDDGRREDSESFNLRLFNASGASYAQRRATVTIQDDD